MNSQTPDTTGRSPAAEEAFPLAVLHSRSLSDLEHLQADLFAAEVRSAGIFLNLVRETAVVRSNESELLAVIGKYTFQAFPQATHLVLAVRQADSPELRVLSARSRAGEEPAVPLSTTLVNKVINEGVSLLYSRSQGEAMTSESLVLSRISNAMCAPLCSVNNTFGVIELDVRRPGTGVFTGKDVDRMAVFANYVAVVLDNHRLNQEQVRAFESTINALVHSLSLKDPDTARHSERVQKAAVIMGRALGLAGTELEALSVAAILHDLGKQGVRDAVLLKPAQLSDGERKEMAHHADLTQNILDRITYPAHLKDVPLMAAYHHEKMNGSGHYRLAGNDIPIQSRIISVADAFDALISTRVYKKAKPLSEVLEILDRGSGRDWDPAVIACLKRSLPRIVSTIYAPAHAEQPLVPEQMDAAA